MNTFKIFFFSSITKHNNQENTILHFRAARYSKINLDIVLSGFDIQDNNRYNISIQFSIQYQNCGDKNVKNLALS